MQTSHARGDVPNSAANSPPTPFWRTKFRCGQSPPYRFKTLISLIFLAVTSIFWMLEPVFSLLSGRDCCPGGGEATLIFEEPEAVDAVEGRHFVAFCQCGVIEHRVDEVVDRAAERQNCLADVDQLARPFADDVDAEQLAGLAMKDQFQEPGNVAEDLAAGDLLVARLADLVGRGGLGPLLLVLADHRDFRDRVDAVGEALGRALRLDPEGVAHGEPALLHRSRGECGEPDHVADGVDIGQSRSIMLINAQPSAAIGHETGFGQVELAGGAGAADRIERLFGNDRLAALEMNPNPRAVLVLDDLQFVDALAEPQGGAIFPEMVAELVGDLPVDERH